MDVLQDIASRTIAGSTDKGVAARGASLSWIIKSPAVHNVTAASTVYSFFYCCFFCLSNEIINVVFPSIMIYSFKLGVFSLSWAGANAGLYYCGKEAGLNIANRFNLFGWGVLLGKVDGYGLPGKYVLLFNGGIYNYWWCLSGMQQRYIKVIQMYPVH